MKYTDDELGTIVGLEISNSDGELDGEVQENRAKALDAYLIRGNRREQPGRSTVVSRDVGDSIDAAVATLLPMISSDAVIEVEPNGQEDEASAQMEANALNTVIMERNNGLVCIQESVIDALLLRNGFIGVEVMDDDRVETLRFDEALDDMDPDVLGYLMEPQAPLETRERAGEKSIRVTTRKRHFKIRSIDPVNTYWERDAKTMDLDKVRFFAERCFYTRSDLKKRGIDAKLVDELQPFTAETEIDALARNRTSDTTNHSETHDQDKIECFNTYLLVDMDDDGISERWRVLVAGASKSTVLEKEEVPFIPVACGSAMLYPHRLQGISIFDILEEIQEGKTDLLRQRHDNVRAANNSRIAAVDSMVNMDDVINARPGGVIRVKDINAVLPLPFQDVGAPIEAALNYYDKLRSERAGASLDLLSGEAQIVGETATGIDRQYAAREAKVSLFAKNLAETLIRQLFLKMHQCLKLYSIEPLMVKHSGQWIEVDPAQWPERERVNITVGVSPGERMHMQNSLTQLVGAQLQMMMGGIQTSDQATLFRAQRDWLRLAGFSNPDSYLVDPESPQGQQAAQAAQQQQEQMQAMQQQLQQFQMQLEQSKVELDRYKHDSELEWKYYDSQLDADVAEMKTVADNATKLEQTRIEPNRDDNAATGGNA